MKNLLLLLLFIPVASFSQDPDLFHRDQQLKAAQEEKEERFAFPLDDNGQIKYTSVVEVKDASAKELHSRAKSFVADFFKSYKDVVQLTDDEAKKIVFKGAFSAAKGYHRFRGTIESKDGKYRFIFDQFYYTLDGLSGREIDIDYTKKRDQLYFTKKQWIAAQVSLNDKMLNMVSYLTSVMNTKSADF